MSHDSAYPRRRHQKFSMQQNISQVPIILIKLSRKKLTRLKCTCSPEKPGKASPVTWTGLEVSMADSRSSCMYLNTNTMRILMAEDSNPGLRRRRLYIPRNVVGKQKSRSRNGASPRMGMYQTSLTYKMKAHREHHQNGENGLPRPLLQRQYISPRQ